MKGIKSVSMKTQILGETVTFLHQEKMDCLVTQEGMVELISQLVYYKEEGKSLYPEIYIFDDIAVIKKVIPTSQFCPIGAGEKTKTTMLTALKKCAPLTDGGWVIYILRKENGFDYGLFRNGTPIHSVSISEALIDSGSENLKAILIHQVAEKIIEVRGVTADSLLISFGSQHDSTKSPTENLSKFVDKIILNVPEALKEASKNFFVKLFLEVLQKGHGTLACVINGNRNEIPKRLEDGIKLSQKINIPKMIAELIDKGDLKANSILEGQFSLIVGMMQSDGITVFTDRGEVAAYNVFVKHPEKFLKGITIGGARSRTFLTLSNLIGNGLQSAYIQSQDGKIEYN
jgi:hypothetical protein